MRKFNLFTLIFAAVMLCCGSIFAQSVCRESTLDLRVSGFALTPETAALLTVEVLPNGHINLILSGRNNPTWRALGINDVRAEDIIVGGVPNTGHTLLQRSNTAPFPAGTTNVLTFIPAAPIANGTVIEFNDIVIEYSVGAIGPWPGVTFSFEYDVTGANNCVFIPLATPTINSITPAGVINFTSVSTVNYVYLFRADNTMMHRQSITNGGTINFTTPQPTEFTVRVRAIATNVQVNDDSELSAGVQWTAPVAALPPSAYCAFPITTTGGGASTFLKTIETVGGNIVVSIAGYAGDTGTFFRGASGWLPGGATLNLNVNDVPTAFTRTIGTLVEPARFTYFTLTPPAPLVPGDVITYTGTIEFVTSTNTNGFGTINISYIFGTTCAGLPTLTSNNFLLSFSPTQGTQTFTLTGADLTSDLVITAPHGLNVSPAVITPAADGSVNATVTVTWAEGNVSGVPVVVSGGGLLNPLTIGVQTSGFNEWCNQVIGTAAANNRAFLLIQVSDCGFEIYFDISPFQSPEIVRWHTGFPAIQLNGTTVDTPRENVTSTRIRFVLPAPLVDGDVIGFGNPLVWQISTAGDGTFDIGNAFINGWQTFTVGDGCDLDPNGTTWGPEIPVSSVVIFPNPVTDVLFFTEEVRAVNIFTVLGQRVLSYVNVSQVRVSHLPSGLYIVNAVDADGNQISKVIEVR